MIEDRFMLQHELQFPVLIDRRGSPWIGYDTIIFIQDRDKTGIRGLVQIAKPRPAYARIHHFPVDDCPAYIGTRQENRGKIVSIE